MQRTPRLRSCDLAPYGCIVRREAVKPPLWSRNHHVRRALWHGLSRAVAADKVWANGLLLDVGCGNKPYRSLFPGVHDEHYIGVDAQAPRDLPPQDRPTIVADGTRLPFRDQVFDAALCTQVLNLVPEPEEMVTEVARVLKPGGRLLASGHGLWPVLGDTSISTSNRWRWTQAGWAALMTRAGLEVLVVEPAEGAAATFGQLACLFLDHSLPPQGSLWQVLRRAGFVVINVVSGAADGILRRRGGYFAAVNYITVARKPYR